MNEISNLSDDLKIQFANAWLRNPNNVFEAALSVCGGNVSNAMMLSMQGIHDPEIVAIKEELKSIHGEEYFLPTKYEICHDILHRAKNTQFNDDYVKLIELQAKLRGQISTGTNVQINNSLDNRVMSIPVFVDARGNRLNDDAWEEKLLEQQERLVAK
jgi:hypothetical protein